MHETKTQALACQTVANLYGMSCEEVDAKVEANAPDFITIIELIMSIITQVIENCPQNSNDRLLATIRRPGLFNRSRFRNMVYGRCKSCGYPEFEDDSGNISNALIETTNAADDELVLSVITEAKNPDFLVI